MADDDQQPTGRALIARIEAATGPDSILNGDILAFLGYTSRGRDLLTPYGGACIRIPDFLASLDDAASLVPEGLFWRMASELAQAMIVRRSHTGHQEVSRSGLCCTPALALCAGALRARLAKMEPANPTGPLKINQVHTARNARLDGGCGHPPDKRSGRMSDLKTTPRRCETCRWWSEDDDGDGRGACTILLNDVAARGWRTMPDYRCSKWECANGR
jgi:hypothetical protein